LKQLRKAGNILIGGAILVKGTDLIGHAKSPTALAGDISGMAQLGVAGAISQTMLGIALKPYKKKK